MAAGTSSRFVPLSAETPKGLLEVKGEILIERQIRQLHEAGIDDITVVTGYLADKFEYLKDKFGVELVYNEDYARYNNTSSVVRVLDRLADTYLCSSDNYFPRNVFLEEPRSSYYSALYAEGPTGEYCITSDADGNIAAVTVGGADSWYMVGHVYFSKEFSDAFRSLMIAEYDLPETRQGYWEDLYIKHLDELPKLGIHRYNPGDIEEFDSLDELREFDRSYITDTRSSILKEIAGELGCGEEALSGFTKLPHEGDCVMFSFLKDGERYRYDGAAKKISRL